MIKKSNIGGADMVFRTVFVTKSKSDKRKRSCNYSFVLIMNVKEEKGDTLKILEDAADAFANPHYFGIGTISRVDDDKIIMQIKDFPERKEKLLQKDMKKFAQRLYKLTGTLYFFEMADKK